MTEAAIYVAIYAGIAGAFVGAIAAITISAFLSRGQRDTYNEPYWRARANQALATAYETLLDEIRRELAHEREAADQERRKQVCDEVRDA